MIHENLSPTTALGERPDGSGARQRAAATALAALVHSKCGRESGQELAGGNERSRLETSNMMPDILLHPQVGRQIAEHLDAASLVMSCDACSSYRNLYLPFFEPLARARLQQLHTSSRLVLQEIVREALVRTNMSRTGGEYHESEFNRGVHYDHGSTSGHSLCAALVVLAERAKQIPQHLVIGFPAPLDVDLGPYNISTDKETAYDHALHDYGFIGRKAGDMMIAGKTFSISAEYSKICPSLLIRPVRMVMAIQGSIKISVDSRPGAAHRDNVTVKQRWPPFTLWSKSHLEEFAHSRDITTRQKDVIEHGLSYFEWGMFLTKLTGDFPPNPPFDPQSWASPDYHVGSGKSHTLFTAHQTDKKKQIAVFKYRQELGRSVWHPL